MEIAYREIEKPDSLYVNQGALFSPTRIELAGIKCRSPLWRRLLAWLGFKSLGRWEVHYRFIQRAHVDTEME